MTRQPYGSSPRTNLLSFLAADVRGNVLALTAAAMIPLIAMIGSGLDMARAYVVRNRLQQACDASVLAGRKAMTGTDVNDGVRAEVGKYFWFNFKNRMMGSQPTSLSITLPNGGTLQVSAATAVPTSIMKVFGFSTIPVSASCQATQNFENIDIVLVLDVTGSMNDKLVNGTSKIDALKSSVLKFYDQLESSQTTLENAGYRLRYSIVPYSQSVNVGRLLWKQNSSFLRDAAPYFRVTNYRSNGSDYDVDWATNIITHNLSFYTSSGWNGCIEERRTVASMAQIPSAAELAKMYDLDIDRMPDTDPDTHWAAADPDPNLKSNFPNYVSCPAQAMRLNTISRSDLSTYLNGLSPTGATYLDVGMIWGARMLSNAGVFPDSPDTYNGMRTTRHLVFLTDGEMDPQAISYTAYGIEEGQRRIAGGSAPNPLIRVFATADSMHDDLAARHNARFDALCDSVRRRGISIWTIKISDKPMDQHLQNCATNSQAVTVADQDSLNAQFQKIAKSVSNLRVSQ